MAAVFVKMLWPLLAQSPEIFRRDTEHLSKHPGKMKRIRKARFLGDAFDQGAGLLQLLGCVIHFETQQILIRAFAIVAAEQPAKVGFVGVAIGGYLVERAEPEKMLL